MDKIENIKSAIASATAVDSKKRPGVVASAPNNEVGQAGEATGSTAVNPVSHSKSLSTVSSKTLTETLERSEEKVREAVEEINSELVKLQSEVGFSVDGTGANLVVTVKRKESGEIVRQIPSEMALQLAANLEKLKGLIIDDFS